MTRGYLLFFHLLMTQCSFLNYYPDESSRGSTCLFDTYTVPMYLVIGSQILILLGLVCVLPESLIESLWCFNRQFPEKVLDSKSCGFFSVAKNPWILQILNSHQQRDFQIQWRPSKGEATRGSPLQYLLLRQMRIFPASTPKMVIARPPEKPKIHPWQFEENLPAEILFKMIFSAKAENSREGILHVIHGWWPEGSLNQNTKPASFLCLWYSYAEKKTHHQPPLKAWPIFNTPEKKNLVSKYPHEQQDIIHFLLN